MGDWKKSLIKWLNHQQTGLKDDNKCSKILNIHKYTLVKNNKNTVIRLVFRRKIQGNAKPITKQGPKQVYIVEYKNKHEETRYFTILNITEVTNSKSALPDGLVWFVCEKGLKINHVDRKKPTKGKVEFLRYTQTGTIVM